MNTLAIKALAAASLSLLAVVPAAAEEVHTTVRYDDLDIASPAGLQALVGRLQSGIKTVCARPDSRDLKAISAWHECKDAAMASAVEQLARKGAAVEGTSLALFD